MTEVEIFATDTCEWCKKARDYADADPDIRYVYFNMTKNPHLKRVFEKRYPGVKTVPQITVDGKHVGGYSEFVLAIETNRNELQNVGENE